MTMNQRLAKSIKPLTREEAPDCLIFWDSETRLSLDEVGEENVHGIQEPFLFCGLVYFRCKGKWIYHRPITATKANLFLDRIKVCIKDATHVWMIAHNANYDCLAAGVMTWLETGELTWFKDRPKGKSKVREVPFFSTDKGSFHLQTWHGSTRIDWIDSLNWFQNSVEELGRSVGLEKLPMPEPDDLLPDWRSYCFRDCEIIADAVLGLMKKMEALDFGQLRPTLASTAFAVYRKRFLRQEIDLPKSEFIRRQARQAYFGGWVWPYSLGKIEADLVQLDVVSMYPSVMLSSRFPTRFLCDWVDVPLVRLDQLAEKYHLLALCEVEAATEPVLLRIHQRTLPVLGRATVWLTHEEIVRRLREGEIIKAHKVHLYYHAPIFQDFIESLWRLRQEFTVSKDEVGRLVSKLLMNSLYGKFGQRGAEYRYIQVPANLRPSMPEFIVDEGGDVVESRHCAGGLLRIKRDEGESHYSHPAIAATVTALARWTLWDLIRLIGRDDVFYSDTDSILTSMEGFLRAKDLGLLGNTLGKLKPEFFASGANVYGKKDYKLSCTCLNRVISPNYDFDCPQCHGEGAKVRLKGVSPKAQKLDRRSPEAAAAIAAAGVDPSEFPDLEVFLSERPQKMTQLFHGRTDGQVRWQEEVKVVRRRFTDGMVSREGRTLFFTLRPGDQEAYALDRRSWLDLGK